MTRSVNSAISANCLPKVSKQEARRGGNIKLSGIWAKCAVFWQFGAKDRQSHTLLTQHWKEGVQDKTRNKRNKFTGSISDFFLANPKLSFSNYCDEKVISVSENVRMHDIHVRGSRGLYQSELSSLIFISGLSSITLLDIF